MRRQENIAVIRTNILNNIDVCIKVKSKVIYKQNKVITLYARCEYVYIISVTCRWHAVK